MSDVMNEVKEVKLRASQLSIAKTLTSVINQRTSYNM